MKKILEKKRSEKRVLKYALRKCSVGVVSVTISVSLIANMATTVVYAAELTKDMIEQSTVVEDVAIESKEEISTDTVDAENIVVDKLDVEDKVEAVNKENSIESIALNNDIDAKINAVKDDLAAVKYEDLFDTLQPYIRSEDRTQVSLELNKELGKWPSQEQIDARLKVMYMDMLDLRKSFNKVQETLDILLRDIFENSSYVNTNHVINNKHQLIMSLCYLDRQYSFSFNGNTAKDIILDSLKANNDLLYDLIKIGTVNYSDLELKNNLVTYNKKIAPITKETDILDFIENSIRKFEPSISASDWFKRESKAYIYEVKSQYGDTNFYNKMKKDVKVKAHLIPLLTLTEDSIYVISTMSTVNYGLIDTYVDRNDNSTRKTFEADIEKTAKQQEAFLNFWYRISDKRDKLLDGNNIIIIDTMQRYGTGSAENLWLPKYGDNTLSGIREFITPLNFYSNYIFADGQASGTDMVSLFVAKSLRDRGQACYTHELTHLLDNKVWLNGYGRRSGKGVEAFATGLFESVNNTVGESNYSPIFSLNLAYELGENRVQNASVDRFKNEDDLKEYMQGLMDVIYTLDYAEAQASLGKTDDDKAILFNELELTPDVKSNNDNEVTDTFKFIDADTASSLTTINDLIEKNIVSGRLTFKGDQTTGTADSNGYYVVPLFEPIYAGVQNNKGAVGDVTFRRYAYELLAEYGYRDGMAAYVSDQYANDEEALKAILDDEYNGSLIEFKKAMFARRIDKLSELKETAYFKNYEELQELMNEAVNEDLTRMKANKQYNNSITLGVNAVNNLKTEILQWYLNNTDDFSTSIYKKQVVVSQDKEVTTTIVPKTTINEEDDTLWEDETRTVEGIDGIVTTTKVWRTEDGNRVGDPTVTTETTREMKPTVVYKGTKKIAGEIVTVKNDVIIPITEREEEDPNLYIGEERKVLGEAGIKKVTTVQKTEKGKPVGNPIVTEEILKEMRPTIIYKGTKELPSQDKPEDVDFVKDTLIYNGNLDDMLSAILDNVVIEDNSLVESKEVIGEIPSAAGEYTIAIRISYRDGRSRIINMPIKIETSEESNNNSNNDDNTTNNNTNSSNTNINTNISNNSVNTTVENKAELANTGEVKKWAAVRTSDNIINKTPMYLVTLGAAASLLSCVWVKIRKKKV